MGETRGLGPFGVGACGGYVVGLVGGCADWVCEGDGEGRDWGCEMVALVVMLAARREVYDTHCIYTYLV